jgi:hypothetical protein
VRGGNLEAALKAYRDSLAIREKLAAQDPSNAEWQRDLIVSNLKLGEVAEQQGQAPDAMRRYGGALEVAKALQASGRLAPVNTWILEELEARLERVGAQARTVGLR